MVLVHLRLEWNAYLFLNSDIVNFAWKIDKEGEREGEGAESIVLSIFVLWRCFNRRWVRGCRWGRKSYLGPAEFSSFSSQDLSWRNKLWFILACCIEWIFQYILFLWAIFLDFLPSKIYKHFVLPLPSITFTTNSQADNHFYKHIYLFQILYSMRSVFY